MEYNQFTSGEEYIVINRNSGEVTYWVPDDKGYFSKWNNKPSAGRGNSRQ